MKFYNSNSSCILASIKENNINKLKKNFTIHLNKNSVVNKVVEKPRKPKTNIKGVGVYLFSKDIFEAIKKTSRSQNQNKELGITESIQTLIDNNKKVLSSICVKEDVITLFCDYYDCMGVCDGNATEDCNGDCNGTAKLD